MRRKLPYDDTPARDVRDWLTRVEGRFMGTPIDVDPHDALMHAIRVMAGEVAYCDAQISRLSEDELFERPTQEFLTRVDGRMYVVEETRDAEVFSRWVTWRDSSLEKLAKYSKMAIDAGVDERRVRMAERAADVLVPMLEALADDLQLSREQRNKLPLIISSKLRELESTTNGSTHEYAVTD